MKLGLFKGEDRPNRKVVWDFYERGRRYNDKIDLDATVRCNENFYIGKQWEGVEANGLPTPVFNFIKRVVMFDVASISASNIKVNATSLASSSDDLIQAVDVVNDEFDALTEQNNIQFLQKELARNAAVDNDGCLYTYWDADADTGQDAKGTICTEVLDNTDVFFGNPMERMVQKQPYIIIRSLLPTREVRIKAKENGAKDWELIQPDNEYIDSIDQEKICDDMTTLLLVLWKKDGSIWGYECTQDCEVTEPWDLSIPLYPIVWLNWDYVKNSYHGQGLVTGILNNQIFVNRAYASSFLSLNRAAFSKYAVDGTRVASLDNRIGGVVKVNGDPTNAIKIIDPPVISPQVSEYISKAIEDTEKCLGATSVALGDTRPDNTSAIIALQRAAATPIELTKQYLYKAIEDLYRIYLAFMGEYYGKRYVDTKPPQPIGDTFSFAGQETPDKIHVKYDFSLLKKFNFKIKLDVGDSSFYSESASINSLDKLFEKGAIDEVQYLSRLPKGHIPDSEGLIAEIKAAKAMMQQPMTGGPELQEPGKMEIPNTGGGYGALQRKINETGDTAAVL